MKTKKQLKKSKTGGFSFSFKTLRETLREKVSKKKPNAPSSESKFTSLLRKNTSPGTPNNPLPSNNNRKQTIQTIINNRGQKTDQIKNETTKRDQLNLIKSQYQQFIDKLPELRNNIKLLHDKLKVDNLSSFNKKIIGDLDILLDNIKSYYFNENDKIKNITDENITDKIKELHTLMKHKESTTKTPNTVKKSFNTSFNTNNASTRTLEYDVMVLIKNLEFMLFCYRLYLHGKDEKNKLTTLQSDIIHRVAR